MRVRANINGSNTLKVKYGGVYCCPMVLLIIYVRIGWLVPLGGTGYLYAMSTYFYPKWLLVQLTVQRVR